MNPDTTVFIPVPVSEKPIKSHMRYSVIGKNTDGNDLSGISYYEEERGFMNDLRAGFPEPLPDYFTHWLKPVKLSEITTSQPEVKVEKKGEFMVMSSSTGIFPDLGKVSKWLEENGQADFSYIVCNAMTELANLYSFKYDKVEQPVKSNEDILVKALKAIYNTSEDKGVPGCKWGETEYDSESVAFGYNNCLAMMQLEANKALSSYRTSEKRNVVCYCGSLRVAMEAFKKAEYDAVLKGEIALLPCCMFVDIEREYGAESDYKQLADALHKRKIDISDEVMVLNVSGYIGQSTRSEIEYAHSIGKPIKYLEPINPQQ